MQPSQSPDANVLNLCFFNNLQSDTKCVAKSNLKELRDVVTECWDAYSLERMDACWRCLFTSYHGILEALGDNTYKQHRGDRKRKRAGLEEDRAVTLETLATARAARARLERGIDVPSAPHTPGHHDSEDEAC